MAVVMFGRKCTLWFRAHRIFTIALAIAVVHFILINVVGHYIAVQVGTQVGHVVAEGLIGAYQKHSQNTQKSEEEANRISQDMKNETEGIIETWKPALFLISLPIKPLMNPFLKNIRDTRIKMVFSKEISKDQFYNWWMVIDYTANLINSFCVGFLFYVILRISRHYKMEA